MEETDRASEDVAFVVGREFNKFRKIFERVEKVRGKMICGIVEMNVKVAADDKLMRCGGCKGEKRIEILNENGAFCGRCVCRLSVCPVLDLDN